jgi:hypothetical protein
VTTEDEEMSTQQKISPAVGHAIMAVRENWLVEKLDEGHKTEGLRIDILRTT